jgi:hypothetical protein
MMRLNSVYGNFIFQWIPTQRFKKDAGNSDALDNGNYKLALNLCNKSLKKGGPSQPPLPMVCTLFNKFPIHNY